ncbi:MAG: DUF4320 family protein [Clostridium sp.]|uniref:DUF4320 family protein n=1 Tax=Clostridium sp. TaxID=1506 RepID=UPI0029076F0B|nr:DUF4320 family protein [Clostridium sp.]MDU4843962.1 DUF4320 family protein [Leclercia adecarboxylata]MDU7089589.1 DUF4320 family protein [Clostridium sp.]
MIEKYLKNKKGGGYIDAVIVILVSSLMIAFAVNVYPVFVAKSQLNHFANEIVREAEVTGQIGDSVNSRTDKLKKELIEVDSIKWDAKYISGTKKIQLNDSINVTLEKKMNIGFFTFGSFPINVQAKDSGFSEVFHK